MFGFKHTEYWNLQATDGSAAASGGSSAKAVDNQATIGALTASGVNSVGVSAPHIVQYPRPPKRDDGRWLALSSVIGNIIGKLSSQKVIQQAKDAESEWKAVMRKMKEIADAEYDRVAPLRDKAQQAMDDLDKRNVINWQRADQEFGYGEQLKPCIDSAADDLCALSECGYTPDYDGILTRVTADAELAMQKELGKICRMVNRYNSGWCCDITESLAVATQSAIIANTNKMREEERLKKWQMEFELKSKVFQTLEGARQNRQQTSQNYDRTASAVRAQQYSNYTADAAASLKMGADLMAAHGQNAAWLAESLRRTAKEAMADWGTLAVMIYTLIATWNSKGNAAKADDCGSSGSVTDNLF